MMRLCSGGWPANAYHAKPAVRAQAMVAINEGGLNRLLEVIASQPRQAHEFSAILSGC
jgi:hypothetical protein